ncbi:MAG TPA: hypothetical protein VLJ86_10975, partial [Ramlibacter sp.]|nr:hypothetical protein [Ramlibacter sp.]
DFGWKYLQERCASLSATEKERLGLHLGEWVRTVAFAGYHIPALQSGFNVDNDVEAQRVVAQAGLGAATGEVEVEIFASYLKRSRDRLAQWGVQLPVVPHPNGAEF